MTARPAPPSRVLLVDEDIEELAALAAILRQRGLSVALANGTAMACERAKLGRFDVIVAGAELSDPSEDALSLADALAVELGRSPPILLMEREGAARADGDVTLNGDVRVARGDVDALVARIHAIAGASGASRSDGSLAPAPLTHGTLSTIGLGDVLQTLSLEKKSGTLVLTTAAGAADLRLLDGAVVDVVYQRFEGAKALARMLAETDGRFTFTEGTPPVMRRMHLGTPELLRNARAQVDDTRRLRKQLDDLTRKALLAIDADGAAPANDISPTARAVLAKLRGPHTLDDVLDDSPEPDASLLAAVAELDQAGRLKRLAHETHRVPLVPTDQLHLVRALVSRATAPGFSGAARLVFAGTPTRLSVFAHAAIWLADAIAPAEAAPTVPIPYAIATVRLGDDIELELVALPLVPAYAPLWSMTLAGAAVVVRLDDAAGSTLSEACAAADLLVLDAQALVGALAGALDEASVTQVASLVRAAVEATHGV